MTNQDKHQFFVDPEEENRDTDTTPDCLGSKQSVLEDDVSSLSGSEREMSPPSSQVYVFPA